MAILPKPCAVLFVADVGRLRDFYRQVAAMELVHSELGHAILEVQGFQLVIHQIHGETATQPNESGHVSVRDDSYFKLCLPVMSIAAARSIANSLGGSIKTTEHEWQANGILACDGHDPEGNVIQVRQADS